MEHTSQRIGTRRAMFEMFEVEKDSCTTRHSLFTVLLVFTPKIVQRVFLAPLEGSKRCADALHDSSIIRVLLTNISWAISISLAIVTFHITLDVTHFFDKFFRLAKKKGGDT